MQTHLLLRGLQLEPKQLATLEHRQNPIHPDWKMKARWGRGGLSHHVPSYLGPFDPPSLIPVLPAGSEAEIPDCGMSYGATSCSQNSPEAEMSPVVGAL